MSGADASVILHTLTLGEEPRTYYQVAAPPVGFVASSPGEASKGLHELARVLRFLADQADELGEAVGLRAV